MNECRWWKSCCVTAPPVASVLYRQSFPMLHVALLQRAFPAVPLIHSPSVSPEHTPLSRVGNRA